MAALQKSVMKENKRYRASRKILIFWTLFIGIGAMLGGIVMLVDPSGEKAMMAAMLPYFQVLPFADVLFQDLVFSGIMLIIVNGITNLTAAALLFAKKKAGTILGGVFGLTLMMWITIQFVIFPANFMSTTYFIFGALQLLTGILCYVGYEQSLWSFKKSEYKNVGRDKSKAVVFYSRTGYTKKLAYELANSSGACVFELKTTEKTDGNLGFWWCGRFGMHKWGMPLEKYDFSVKDFSEVTLCSPVWVFDIAAPTREFLKKERGNFSCLNLVFVHFMGSKLSYLEKNASDAANVKSKSFRSFRSHFGKLKEIE